MNVRTFRLINIWSKVFIAISLITIILIKYVQPFVVTQLYAGEYKRLALECDNAMHDEVALRSLPNTSGKQALLIKSADVGLMVCHEYDKLRKKMLITGVTDEQLALLGLEALEVELIPVSRMVEPHRMPRF